VARAARREWTMKSPRILGTGALLMALAVAPAITMAQSSDENAATTEPDERVVQYDLAGPRIGATFAPDGSAISQFGWHFENQASPGRHGPWFIVEKVFLIGGLERNQFIPNANLIFGMRTASSFEFGLGPSVTLGGYRGFNSGIVFAAGHSFRAGGIRIPVNVAYAAQQNGEGRWTLITGWAIRNPLPAQQPVDRDNWPHGRPGRGGI
jgi:hypothetical protein